MQKCYLTLYSLCLIAGSLVQWIFFPPILFMKLLRGTAGDNLSVSSPVRCNAQDYSNQDSCVSETFWMTGHLLSF